MSDRRNSRITFYRIYVDEDSMTNVLHVNQHELIQSSYLDAYSTITIPNLSAAKNLQKLEVSVDEVSNITVIVDADTVRDMNRLSDIHIEGTEIIGDISRLAVPDLRKLVLIDNLVTDSNLDDLLQSLAKNSNRLSVLVIKDFRSDDEEPVRLTDSLNNLMDLTELEITDSGLSGPIPDLYNLYRLTDLDLSHNNLTGSIPSTISNLVSLRTLDLSHNRLTGSLPESMKSMSNLFHVKLQYNQLSGQFPNNIIDSLPELWQIDLSNNPDIEGEISVRLRDRGYRTVTIYVGNTGAVLTEDYAEYLESMPTKTVYVYEISPDDDYDRIDVDSDEEYYSDEDYYDVADY